jgi:tetratricopeptide (TPR) repeat protein
MSLNKEKLFFVFVIFVIGLSFLNVNSALGDEEENFTFFLDNFQYSPRDVIEISGWVKDVTASEIFIEITNPDDQIIIQENSSLKEIQEIDHIIPTLGTEWDTFGFYQIKLFYGNETQSRFFGFGDFNPNEFEPQITLDKENYSWTDTVKIMVVSPNDNQNNHQTDKIKVDISSSLGTLSDYTLEEIGIMHGIFEGEVHLTGHSEFDVDGDGRGDDVRGITFGVGPEEGNLAVRPNDNIKVSFLSSHFDEIIENTTNIQFHKGQIEWLQNEFEPNEKPVVRIIDPDLKLQPTKKDQVEILISSYPQGYSESFTLSETENDSGIFEGFIRFIDSPKDDGVLVRSGSIVTAKYDDRTLPSEYSVLTLDITANATVIEIAEPQETIPVEEGIDVERAEKLIELGNYLGLLSYSNEILNQNLQNIDALYYKGIALWGYYRNNISPHPETVETLDKVLAVNPEHIGALYYKAKSLYQIKEYDKALIVINKVLSINPNYKDASAQKQLILDEKINGSNSPSSDVDRLISTAGSLSVRKDYTGAFRVIDQALELEPNNAEALHAKGSIFLRQENYNDALFWIDKALENNSNLVHALHDKGLILFELGNIQESKIWFDRAMSEPGYEEVLDVEFILNNLGRRLFESENYQDSLFWYDKAIELKPDAHYFLNNKVIALNEIGRNYLEEENPEEALVWFEKGLELDPDAVFLLNNKGWALYQLGNPEESIIWFDKALAEDPGYSTSLVNKVDAFNEIGLDYLEEENPEEALVWFEKGLELDPDAVFLLNNKGLAYYHLGENEKAIAAYDKALTIDPSYELAQENKELVEGSFYETIRPIIFIVIFGSITYGMYYVKKRRQKHIRKTRKIINEPSFSVLKLRWGGSNITYQVIFDKERLLLIRPDKIKSEYENVSLDEILRMDKLNYDIPFYEISQVEMNQSTHGVNGARAGKMTIDYKNKKDSFDILETESFDNCANLARSYLGMKLVIS